MLIRNTPERYGAVHKTFHWIVAALIIANLTLGIIAANIGMSPGKFKLFWWHKSIGITVLALASLRILWKLANPHPAKNPDHAGWERGAAAIVHALLYWAMFTIPLTGWLMSSAKGISVSVFGWFVLPDLVQKNHGLGEALETYHDWAAYILIGVIVLHAAGAFKHHFIDHDDTLRRMMPFGTLKRTLPLLAFLTFSSFAAHAADAPSWTIDAKQSTLAIAGTQNDAPFTGKFAQFGGTIKFDAANLPGSSVAITIPITSLNTGSAERDPYLSDPAWLDGKKFPTATFTATKFDAKGGNAFIAHGALSLHGVTLPVDLPFTLTTAPDGKTATVDGKATLKRLDFGIGGGQWADPHTVGNAVTVNVHVVAHKA